MTAPAHPDRAPGRPAWPGVAFAAVWLIFLVPAVQEAWRSLPGWRGWLGLVALGAFVVVYLATFSRVRARRHRGITDLGIALSLAILTALVALGLLATVAVGQEGTSTAVYVAVTAVMCLPTPGGVAAVTLLAIAVDLSGRLVDGWDEAANLALAVCTAGFAMWGVRMLMLRNVQLLRAEAQNVALAAAEERNRLARDLHDILGHSLTVITVKAELAGRLLETDPERARAEVADLERLSRDALGDVRRAVSGYRELSLPAEVARARTALAAAGIEADLPHAVEEPCSELRELFAWALREGVTNVVRHSGAQRCRVRMGPTWLQVADDGAGPAPGTRGAPGAGLAGLRERAAGVGATVSAGRTARGFVLEVRAK